VLGLELVEGPLENDHQHVNAGERSGDAGEVLLGDGAAQVATAMQVLELGHRAHQLDGLARGEMAQPTVTRALSQMLAR